MLDLILAPLEANTAYFITVVTVLGLLVGSFLNVVIYRLPKMLNIEWQAQAREILELPEEKTERFNLIKPDSHCPGCQKPVKAWQNIPLLSYALLKGKCEKCGHKIGIRYPLVELVTGLLSLAVAVKFGFGPQMMILLFVWMCVAMFFIDWDTQLLPDNLTMPLIWLGLIYNLLTQSVAIDLAIYGAIAGYLSLWSIFWVYKLITGKDGMGYGDFKLLAAFGAWFGISALPLIILLSSLVGAIIGIIMLRMTNQGSETKIAFGPYLIFAGMIYLFFGPEILAWYLGMY